MVQVNAGRRTPSHIVINIPLTLMFPVRLIRREQGLLEVASLENAHKLVEYLKYHGYPEAKIEEEK